VAQQNDSSQKKPSAKGTGYFETLESKQLTKPKQGEIFFLPLLLFSVVNNFIDNGKEHIGGFKLLIDFTCVYA